MKNLTLFLLTFVSVLNYVHANDGWDHYKAEKSGERSPELPHLTLKNDLFMGGPSAPKNIKTTFNIKNSTCIKEVSATDDYLGSSIHKGANIVLTDNYGFTQFLDYHDQCEEINLYGDCVLKDTSKKTFWTISTRVSLYAVDGHELIGIFLECTTKSEKTQKQAEHGAVSLDEAINLLSDIVE